jgi:hypothetical protein
MCGSTKFKEDYLKWIEDLTFHGALVLFCPIFHHADKIKIPEDKIQMIRDIHMQRIRMCDEIFVVNKDGYIGPSTREEIEYATKLGKDIWYMEPIEGEVDDNMEIEKVEKIVEAVAGQDPNINKAINVANDISELNKIVNSDGSTVDKVINVLDEVAAPLTGNQMSYLEEKAKENKLVKIISGFPGIGKSWLFDNQEKLGIKVSDSDSSKFSWISEGVRNPDFPNNYIEHIKEIIKTVDVVLVSSHDVVRDALKQAGLEFLIVYPDINDKDEYIKRFIQRGSNEAFVKLISDNWDQWVANISSSTGVKVQLNLGEYLSDLVLDKDKDPRLSLSISGKF